MKGFLLSLLWFTYHESFGFSAGMYPSFGTCLPCILSISLTLVNLTWSACRTRDWDHWTRPGVSPEAEVFGAALCDFMSDFSVFNKFARNEKYPLFSCTVLNQARASSSLNSVYVYRPPECRTQKHLNSFFPYQMLAFNKQWWPLFNVMIQFYRMLIHRLQNKIQ